MISDSHTDFITELKSAGEREEYVKRLKKQKVKSVVCAVFTTNKKITLGELKAYKDEIERLKTKYGVDLIFAVEDMGFLIDEQIQEFINLKPFSTTLTWNCLNQFAGGAKDKGGLTQFGKKTIKQLESNNILVDTAHLNKKSFWQFAQLTRKPIFNSHSNIFSINKHCRNLTDKQIQKIVDSNGFLGLTIYDEFVAGEKISSLDIAKQFDYLIKKFGYNNFGFGTDFYGINKTNLPVDIKDYVSLRRNVNKHLKEMGYNKKIINRLMYKNLQLLRSLELLQKKLMNYLMQRLNIL